MMNEHYANLQRMLTNTYGPIVLSPAGKNAIRWAIGMISTMGDALATESGKTIADEIRKASEIVEASEEWRWSEHVA
jgi:hypothetical protein